MQPIPTPKSFIENTITRCQVYSTILFNILQVYIWNQKLFATKFYSSKIQ